MPEKETEAELKRRLHEAEHWLMEAREHADRWEAHRDSLLRQLTDLSGADSSRYVAVR